MGGCPLLGGRADIETSTLLECPLSRLGGWQQKRMPPLAIAIADRHRGRQSLAVCREVSTGTILKFAPNELGAIPLIPLLKRPPQYRALTV